MTHTDKSIINNPWFDRGASFTVYFITIMSFFFVVQVNDNVWIWNGFNTVSLVWHLWLINYIINYDLQSAYNTVCALLGLVLSMILRICELHQEVGICLIWLYLDRFSTIKFNWTHNVMSTKESSCVLSLHDYVVSCDPFLLA